MQESNRKKEILFNTTALLDVWLEKYPEISDLRLVFCHDSISTIIPCSKASCASVLAEKLNDNQEGYTKAMLQGVVGREDKVIGELDIK